jgi:hypothetical protein
MKNWSSILFTLIVLQKIKAQQLQTPPAAISLNEPIICDCGFEDENANVWSNVWYANYSSYQTRLQHDHFYQVMDFTVDAKYENTWNRVFSPHNVKLTGEGVRLTVKQQTPGVYTSASVGTKR